MKCPYVHAFLGSGHIGSIGRWL